MKTKIGKTFNLVLMATLVLALAGATVAFAWDGWGGGLGCGLGPGRGMGLGPRHLALGNLTPEQAAQIFDLKQKFLNDTAELRKQMLIKAVELAQLWKAEKPDDKAILAKSRELSALRAQFMEKAVAQRLEVRKIAPQLRMFGPGMGPARGFGKGAALSGSQTQAGLEGVSESDLALSLSAE